MQENNTVGTAYNNNNNIQQQRQHLKRKTTEKLRGEKFFLTFQCLKFTFKS